MKSESAKRTAAAADEFLSKETSLDAMVASPVPSAVLLSNGTMATLVSDAGAGYTTHGALALTRWSADRTRDADGHWLYVQDTDDGTCWSAGAQPISLRPERYSASLSPGIAAFLREDRGIEVRTEIVIAHDAPVEIRRYSITNHDGRVRNLQLTTYLELVLNSPAADASHPAFSKLFVQTGFAKDPQLLTAWRRLRSPEDEPLSVAYGFVVDGNGGTFEYETDRARFLGRTRGPDAPAALENGAPLSGTVGNVLDPIFSARRTLILQPGQTQQAFTVLAASATAEEATALASQFLHKREFDTAISEARVRGRRVAEASGVAADWGRVPSAIGRMAYIGNPVALTDTARYDDGALYRAIAERSNGRDANVRLVSPRPAPPSPIVSNAKSVSSRIAAMTTPASELTYRNSYGGFSQTGDEYVMTAGREHEPTPLPWTNVIANEQVGFVVSEKGAGYTWTINSRENRLTPWYNDPVSDPHGEAWYIRDDESGEFWSLLPGPAPSGSSYETRHGIGYSRWQHSHNGLSHDSWMFVPRTEALKILRVRLKNERANTRRLSVYGFVRWMLGANAIESSRAVVTEIASAGNVIHATNATRGEFAARVAFSAVHASSSLGITSSCDAGQFLGRHGNLSAPAALTVGQPLTGTSGAGLDPCAAHRIELSIAAGETAEIIFLLGEGRDSSEADTLTTRYASSEAVELALSDVRAFWTRLRGGVQIESPSPELDLMVNHWLPYQNLSCRIWGRSAFYQSGGAFGFRDQLQDSAAMVYLDPTLTRAQILLHAAHQFVEGDVLHWWHPPSSKGIRTRFSDDLLWLPYICAFYMHTTGDVAILDEHMRFVTGPLLDDDEDERFMQCTDSGEQATVYEHCALALDRSLTAGAHGLPLMGVGDWNDGMNRVGREGRGESVWLGFFLADILSSFIPYCDARGDVDRVDRYRDYRRKLATALNADEAGWDGDWYRRAYYDNGVALGSAASDECRIDAIAQAWSVISGVAPPDRARRALAAMDTYLISEDERLIRLLVPPFDKTPHDPGYIKGYVPGVRENGGQYTHGALWAVRALAESGRHDRAASLLAMLSPVSHGSEANVKVYRGEPYVIAADVYGVAPHVGRAGWTWYTGSAGWMYRTALESIFGFSVENGATIVLQPCIPDAWPGFTLRYRSPESGVNLTIQLTRAKPSGSTVVREELPAADTERPEVADGKIRIPLTAGSQNRTIHVQLGDDLTRQYRQRPDA